MEGCGVKSERCKHGVLRPHECKACADEPSKDEIAAWARSDGLHTHEARRWCHGDDAWSRWQPCTAEQAASYAKDETFQVRAAGGEG